MFDGTSASPKLVMEFSIWRAGKQITIPLTTGAQTGLVEPLELILRDAWLASLKTDVGIVKGERVDIDTKIQRKLKEGDLLKISFISNGSTATWDTQLEITYWLKQA